MDKIQNDWDNLCKAIGFIVINWAICEQGLDQWVAIIYHHCGGNKLDKEIPRNLKKKVRFLERAFHELPTLLPFKNECLDILKNVIKTSKDRHDYVHGALKGPPVGNGTFEFAKIDYEQQIHRIRQVKLDPAKFSELSKAVTDLAMIVPIQGDRMLRHLGLLPPVTQRPS